MNTSLPKFSIIIPCYSSEGFISQTLDSLVRQSYKNFEVVIVNDGSTDNSSQIVKQYENKLLIKYIEQENKGIAAARNVGVKNASGDIIGLLDHDDLYVEDTLLNVVYYFKEHKDIDFYPF